MPFKPYFKLGIISSFFVTIIIIDVLNLLPVPACIFHCRTVHTTFKRHLYLFNGGYQ